jgi:hypothetical protein
MNDKREALGRQAKVKATMLKAHLAWAEKQVGDLGRLVPHLDAECAALLRGTLSTVWIPLGCLIQIDRAIASVAGGPAERVFRALGRYSASTNLNGVYRSFVSSEPHRFFEQVGVLHRQFQDFGRCRYEEAGARAGRIILEGYTEYSPVYCASAMGYFEEALRMMHAPGPIVVAETSCQCGGASQCVYQMTW